MSGFVQERFQLFNTSHCPRCVPWKAKYGGVLLVLTVLDGDGRVFPGVLGVAESENGDTWSWFIQQVRVALNIGDGHGVVVLSDREKGIDKAVSDFLPRACHSFCVFHIKKTSRRGTRRHWTISSSPLQRRQLKVNSIKPSTK